jgi:hypothetical protein
MVTVAEALAAVGAEPQSGYLSAEVCLQGHPTTSAIEHSPDRTANFCSTCGAKTIRACSDCGAAIRGIYFVPNSYRRVPRVPYEKPPNHCFNCGEAFPWVTAKVEAAKEHAAEIEELSEGERGELKQAIDDLAAGGARTELAASRFRRLMKKAGQTVGSGLYKVVVDVLSEAAKKAVTGS